MTSVLPKQAAPAKNKNNNDKNDTTDSDATTPARQLALLGDRYRPLRWDELSFNRTLNRRLHRISLQHRLQMPNMLFYGPRGAGKRTRVNIFVRSLFTDHRGAPSLIDAMLRHQVLTIDVSRKTSVGGAGAAAKSEKHISTMLGGGVSASTASHFASDSNYQAEDEEDNDAKKKKSSVGGATAFGAAGGGGASEIACVTSPYHLEVTPSDVGRKDIHVIRSCLRHLCQASAPPTSLFRVVEPDAIASAVSKKDDDKNDDEEADNTSQNEAIPLPTYRVIIINQADKLSGDAQAALRCAMEQYAKRVRFVLICEHLSSILDAIQSRCLMVRVPRPSRSEMTSALTRLSSRAEIQFGSLTLQRHYMNRLLDTARDDLTFAISLIEHNNSAEQPLLSRSILEMPDWITVTLGITGFIYDGRPPQQDNAVSQGGNKAGDKTGGKTGGKINKSSALSSSPMSPMAQQQQHHPIGIGPSIEQLQRVHRTFLELLTRCVPTRRLLREMLYMFLDLIAEDASIVPQQAETKTATAAATTTAAGLKKQNAKKTAAKGGGASTTTIDARHSRVSSLQRQVCAIFGFFEPRVATAHRPIIQLNALSVHLNELFARHRAQLPPLVVTNQSDLFPRLGGADQKKIYSATTVPPLVLTEQDISYIRRNSG
jgi:DNA polymerase III delta prime subunit